MEQIRKILATTDLSELSKTGVRYALSLAKALGAEVTVYLVVSREELIHYGRELTKGTPAGGMPHVSEHFLEEYKIALARFLGVHFSDLIPWVKIRERVELGTPDRNIVEQATREGSDLIVISTHGRSGLSHALLGSVTEKVVRHAPCPVLSIPPQREEKMEERVPTAA
jgi:nucleotide-binding universal stress UspA family protein